MYECIYVYNFKWSCTAQGENAPHKSHRLTETSVSGMENIPLSYSSGRPKRLPEQYRPLPLPLVASQSSKVRLC